MPFPGQPLTNPINGKYYDWPVGFHMGSNLADFWKLEEHKLGETSFTHFPDGTAHKNRMQGNDFVQSLMYNRGVACFSCHDVHGTSNEAQLRGRPARCASRATERTRRTGRTRLHRGHTHHKPGSTGNQCIACHMPKIEQTIADVNVSGQPSTSSIRRESTPEDSERVQRLPYGQNDGVGNGRPDALEGPLALARERIGKCLE